MLISTYDLQVTTLPCNPESERWGAFARLIEDIGEVFPYLNSRLEKCVYDHRQQVLTWHTDGHDVCLRSFEIAISDLEDREQAQQAVDEMVELINETWERRHDIRPNYHKQQRPNPYRIYALLPGDNCKKCGEATCLAFAVRLALGETELVQCEPLMAPKWAEQREQLQTVPSTMSEGK